MKKLFIFLLILFVSNCSTKKLENNHGLVNLDKKKDEIIVGKTNKNDVLNLFGPASTVSTFDDDIWIYIESKKINQSIFKLGSQKLDKNNTLILEFSERSLVKNIEFIDINKMNNIKITDKKTEKAYSSNSKLYSILTSLREKINAPTRRNRVKQNN
tara:strand:+ start:201 stop:671 length:471 start_codon:yes stop_codon:yes gene_type:complete